MNTRADSLTDDRRHRDQAALPGTSEQRSTERTRAAGAGPSTTASRPRTRTASSSGPQQQQPRNTPVVDLTADDDKDDDDVVFVKSKPGVRRLASALKRPRVSSPAAPPGFLHGLPPPVTAAVPQPPSPDHGRKCAICLENMEQMASTPCGHVFCHQCLIDCVKVQKKCPKCRKSVTLKQIHRIYLE